MGIIIGREGWDEVVNIIFGKEVGDTSQKLSSIISFLQWREFLEKYYLSLKNNISILTKCFLFRDYNIYIHFY